MRVLFLTLYPEGAASSRYRVAQFVPYLESQGIACTVAAPLSTGDWEQYSGGRRKHRPFWYHFYETSARFQQLFRAPGFDVVVVQKALTVAAVRGLDSMLYGLAKRVVYDIDDAVHLEVPMPLPPRYRWLSDPQQIPRLMKKADRVLAGNGWLAEAVRAAGGVPVLFPTVVDTARFVPPTREPGEYTLGWMGTPSTAPSLRVLKKVDPFPQGLRVKVVGAGPDGVDLASSWCEPWHYDTEVDAVQRMSAGLMPLEPSAWARGKCALKALLYMACGRPVIATPFGAVCDIVVDEVHGLFAETPEQWRDAMERMRDEGLRRRLGSAGRALVEAEYSLAGAGPRLAGVLEELR